MLKVLLVDDEILALEDIRAMVDWAELGYEIVGATTSTKKAVELYREYFPQLLITDIVMPVKSGVELGKELLTFGKPLKIFFLTSYQEFSYAREGIQMGVSEYLIKNELDAASLGAALKKARKELEGKVCGEDRVEALLKELAGMSSDRLLQADETIRELFERIKENGTGKYQNDLRVCLRECLERLCSGYGEEYRDLPYTIPDKSADAYELENWFGHCRKELLEVEKAHRDGGRFTTRKIVAYIHRHYHENITIQMLADLFYISPSHLKKMFKRETGYTVLDYVTLCRMRRAGVLLKSGEYRVGEISSLCGYATPQYFSKVFKEYTGYTPFDFQAEGEWNEDTDKTD